MTCCDFNDSPKKLLRQTMLVNEHRSNRATITLFRRTVAIGAMGCNGSKTSLQKARRQHLLCLTMQLPAYLIPARRYHRPQPPALLERILSFQLFGQCELEFQDVCSPGASNSAGPEGATSPGKRRFACLETQGHAIVMLAQSWLSDVHLYHSAEEINASASAGVLNNHLRDTGSYI